MYVPHERRSLLLSLLERRGYLRTAAVARELGVTEETVRNDFIALQQQNLLQRVHGGARYLPPVGGDDDAVRTESQYIRRIMEHAPDHACIYADDVALLRHALALPREKKSFTLITPSLQMANAPRISSTAQHVILPGGILDEKTRLIRAERGPDLFLSAHRPTLTLLCPDASESPQRVAYRHALSAEWAQAACRYAERTVLILRPETSSATATHDVFCTPQLLIAPSDVPSAFLSIPHELIPIITIQDILEAQQM